MQFHENLNNIAIKQKLLQNGYPNIPITETTRKLLIKKLNTERLKPRNANKINNESLNLPMTELTRKQLSKKLQDSCRILAKTTKLPKLKNLVTSQRLSCFLHSYHTKKYALKVNKIGPSVLPAEKPQSDMKCSSNVTIDMNNDPRTVLDFCFEKMHFLIKLLIFLALLGMTFQNIDLRKTFDIEFNKLLHLNQINSSTKCELCFAIIGVTFALIVFTLIINCYIDKLKRNSSSTAVVCKNALTKHIKDELNLLYRRSPKSDIELNALRQIISKSSKCRITDAVWNAALHYLQSSDKSVEFNLVDKHGVAYKTIKLKVDDISNNNNDDKTDVCQKFSNTSPVTCLKIRKMFDATAMHDLYLRCRTKDAILQQVGQHCKIYDFKWDMQQCCIYVRCAHEIDATIAYNLLNNWCYNDRYISVRRLKLNRYLARYPDYFC